MTWNGYSTVSQNTKQFKKLGKPAQMELCPSAERGWYMAVVLHASPASAQVGGRSAGPPDLPPRKTNISWVQHNWGEWTFGFIWTVSYTVASNEQFPIRDHGSGAASIVNTPLDTRNWQDCGLRGEEEEECSTLADLEKLSWTTSKHNWKPHHTHWSNTVFPGCLAVCLYTT